jgi:REP element-mobilizing transposase RayT
MASGKSNRSRPRKRHLQQQLFRRGGKRRGAGRKPSGPRAGERHTARTAFQSWQPLHVVMRVTQAVGSLRRSKMYQAMRKATATAARRGQFRVVHVSLQRTHVHLIVEAEHSTALSRGMQGLTISAARHINIALGDRVHRRCGKVFADRYHAKRIASPTQARHAISYVLANWRKHGEDREGQARNWMVDPFSSAILFADWAERAGKPWPIPAGYEPLVVQAAETWLLREGWKRGGAPISVRDVPSRLH